MKKWYWMIKEKRSWTAYGKGGESVNLDDMTDNWLSEFGFATRAAAVRSAGGNWVIDNPRFAERVLIDSRDVAGEGLKFKIYRCFEVVIEDKDGNQIGESEYVYTCRKDAESMARHKLKLAMIDWEG